MFWPAAGNRPETVSVCPPSDGRAKVTSVESWQVSEFVLKGHSENRPAFAFSCSGVNVDSLG